MANTIFQLCNAILKKGCLIKWPCEGHGGGSVGLRPTEGCSGLLWIWERGFCVRRLSDTVNTLGFFWVTLQMTPRDALSSASVGWL